MKLGVLFSGFAIVLGLSPAYAGLFPWPVDPNGQAYRVTSAFGSRMKSRTVFDFHQGIDFGGPPKSFSPVKLLEKGAIKEIRCASNPMGAVYISVKGDHRFRYIHL